MPGTPEQDDFLGGVTEPEDDLFATPTSEEPELVEDSGDDFFAKETSPSAAQSVGAGESYVVLARRYRPQTFDQLVGQESARAALEGAIRGNQIGHAYLFCGPRGTGKTSTARILAKAVNCLNGGPRPDPCGECASCRAITSGSSLDVIEIDAASNTGVDNIRELRSGVVLAPFSRYKVYIVDEVHMLSMAAFNALLKTLEEPPSQVIFVLATTDPQKVPDTIISRCQVFQFRRFSTDEIVKHLGSILDAEAQQRSLQIAPEDRLPILEMIARNAEGGMRDAQVALDQVLVLCRDRIDVETVRRFLGSVRFDLLDAFVRGIRDRNTEELLQLVQQLSETGQDLERFTSSLTEYLRDLLIVRAAPHKPELLNVSTDRFAGLQILAADLPMALAVQLTDSFLRLSEKMKTASQPRFLLEVELMRLSTSATTVDVDNLISRIDELERRVQGGATPTPVAKPSKVTAEAPAPGVETKSQSSKMEAEAPAVPEISNVPSFTSTPSVSQPALTAAKLPEISQAEQSAPPAPPESAMQQMMENLQPDALMKEIMEKLPDTSCVRMALQDATILSIGERSVVIGVNPGDTFTYTHLSRPVNLQQLTEIACAALQRKVNIRLELTRKEEVVEAPSEKTKQSLVSTAIAPSSADTEAIDDEDTMVDFDEAQVPALADILPEKEKILPENNASLPLKPLKGADMTAYLDEHADVNELFLKIRSAFRLADSQFILKVRPKAQA